MTELSPDVGYNAALWLLLAVSLGAMVGLERRLRGHPAGLHTNSLVALGSAAFVICGFVPGADHTRVAGQVVTGVGFLCAGVILHQGADIRGLNTAATVWCASAIGVLAGIGRPILACVLAVMVLMVNIVLHYVEHSILKQEVRSRGGDQGASSAGPS
jgi:putative Mg2+ transporter-C (MgtC) family protein